MTKYNGCGILVPATNLVVQLQTIAIYGHSRYLRGCVRDVYLWWNAKILLPVMKEYNVFLHALGSCWLQEITFFQIFVSSSQLSMKLMLSSIIRFHCNQWGIISVVVVNKHEEKGVNFIRLAKKREKCNFISFSISAINADELTQSLANSLLLTLLC